MKNELDKDPEQGHYEYIKGKMNFGYLSCYMNEQSVGCVLHWLYVYGGLSLSENVQVGEGKVSLYHKEVLEYTWSGNVPIFTLAPSIDAYDRKRFNFIILDQNRYFDYMTKSCGLF